MLLESNWLINKKSTSDYYKKYQPMITQGSFVYSFIKFYKSRCKDWRIVEFKKNNQILSENRNCQSSYFLYPCDNLAKCIIYGIINPSKITLSDFMPRLKSYLIGLYKSSKSRLNIGWPYIKIYKQQMLSILV